MSLNTVVAFALLLKKITRKGSLGKKNFQQRMKKSKRQTKSGNLPVPSVILESKDDHTTSTSSYSDSDFEEEDDYNFDIHDNKSSVVISPASVKSLQHSQIKAALRSSLLLVDDDTISINKSSSIFENDIQMKQKSYEGSQLEQKLGSLSLLPSSVQLTMSSVLVRDFAYPVDSPLHYGQPATPSLENNHSTISLSSPDFTGRDARALFDFKPETEYEIALKAGQSIWVQYRQCPGWLVADVQDETGLIPESYVEFV
ncbi:hypothetical protein EDC96DRAFT_498419 [Choanephora cucurbitarum]|nr:hypothetical protein EDC96DRAFT_498419 [Choanephora cucurbitarum]